MPISSTSNATIKHIRRLRQRKEREQSGLCFIEGIRLVTEALQPGAAIEALIVAPDLLTSAFAWETVMSSAAQVERIEVTPEVFRHISSREGPQGIGALVRQRWEPLAQVRLGNELGWVALDAVQDPGNLGTILRTSDAVGCAGVMLLGHSTDPYDPVSLRASMGAIFAQRLVRASFAEFATWKRQHGYRVIGTSDAATLDYQACRYQPPLVLLMGSERLGLAPEQQALCDQMVSIPMVGRSDSLNLAVATGVMLYEMFNQSRG
jgi:TrmH family RNA methyltransferase